MEIFMWTNITLLRVVVVLTAALDRSSNGGEGADHGDRPLHHVLGNRSALL